MGMCVCVYVAIHIELKLYVNVPPNNMNSSYVYL